MGNVMIKQKPANVGRSETGSDMNVLESILPTLLPQLLAFQIKKTRPCDFSETTQVSIYRCEQDHTLSHWSPTFFPCTARDSLGPKE